MRDRAEVLLSFRVPADVVEFIDSDMARTGASCRKDWLNELLAAARDGRVTVRPLDAPAPAAVVPGR